MHLKQRFGVFFSALVDVFTSRLDLVTAEFEDLILRLGVMLALLVGSVLFSCFTLLFLGLTVMMAVPDAYRWIPALGFMLLFAAGGTLGLWRLRKSLREMPAPFSSTRDVLRRDAAALRPIIEPEPSPETDENSPPSAHAQPNPEMADILS